MVENKEENKKWLKVKEKIEELEGNKEKNEVVVESKVVNE